MKVIADRYKIKDKLGQGGSSITYAAIDNKTNERVAIKALSLSGLDDWKKIELFEREAKILQQLEHRCIPNYIDYFKIETEEDVSFYIVQELAPGQSLAHLVSEGWIPDKRTVKNIAAQILKILVYLQQLTPPVIHRDIKPQNIIYQPDTGELFLVDFGAVQDVYHHTKIGSTVVGTYGYMAPEQYRGNAVLATDLYGLGCSLLFLLTGESPAELPQKKLKIDFSQSVNLKSKFANWIDKLIEPNIERRFPNAEAALLVLQDQASLQDYQSDIITKPRWSLIQITKDANQISIYIPPAYKRKHVNKSYYLCLLWAVISILNRIAFFASVSLFGKLVVAFWLYAVLFINSRVYFAAYNLLFLIPLFISKVELNLIPDFSLILVAIDAIIDICLEDHFIKQLFFSTRIRFQKDDETTIYKKNLFNLPYLKLDYVPYDLANFISDEEESWLESEVKKYRHS